MQGMQRPLSRLLSPLQTMPYMPPELLAQSQLTPKADVYSFGIVMWELLSGQVRLSRATLSIVGLARHCKPSKISRLWC